MRRAPLIFAALSLSLLMLLCAGAARATSDPPGQTYRVVGFSADGKHVYFEKKWDGGAMACHETWLVVYSVTTRRRVISLPMLRAGSDCQKKRISKAAGAADRKKLHKRFGKPAAGTRARVVTKATKPGKGRVHVEARIAHKLPELSKGLDLIADRKRHGSARVRLYLWRAGSKRRRVYDKRMRIDPVADPGGAMMLVWPKLQVSDAMLGAGGKHLAFVFNRRPYVIAAK